MNSTGIHIPKITICSLLCYFLLTATSCGQVAANAGSHRTSIKDAREAFERREHAIAYDIFNNIWNDQQQSLQDRTLAGQYLVKMNWRLYGTSEKAYAVLKQLEAQEYERSTAYVLRSRILADEGRLDEAIAIAQKAIDKAQSETELYHGHITFGKQVLMRSRQFLNDNPQGFDSKNEDLLSAHNTLKELLAENPRDVEAAELYLSSSLLLKDGSEAFRAWMLFYHHKNIVDIHPSLLSEPEKFRKALMSYSPASGDDEVVTTAIKGLAESGFYHAATLLKVRELGLSPYKDREINDLVRYEGFLNEVKRITQDFYRQTIAGNVAIYDYTAQYNELAAKLWDDLARDDVHPAFSRQAFNRTLAARFKTLINFMTSGNYYGLHMGHVILNDQRTISQYGYSADFRYKVIDHMVSNGFSAWFSDGNSQVGGWATDDGSFLQVRAGLGKEMTRIWLLLTDPVESRKVLNDMERFTSMEDAMAEENPYAFLPSLKLRLIYHESTAILDSLKSTGLTGPQLRVGFINLTEKIALDSKIYAHEGRHSIDFKRNYSKSSKELEFTAKLSEIYFSARPKLLLGTIIGPNMGDGTAHGEANLRLIKGLVHWADQHQTEIAGFDTSRPTQPQLDKLSNAQLRQAVRSMDPMAN